MSTEEHTAKSAVYAATAETSSRSAADRVSDMLELLRPEPLAVAAASRQDGSGNWMAVGYFAGRPSRVSLDLIAAASGSGSFEVSRVEEIDWVSRVQEDLRPVEAGRFWIHGSHETGAVPAGLIPIEIDASLAFGTGHHGTTRGCLRVMCNLQARGMQPLQVCDLGCGTGVLAIAAAKLWNCPVTACDSDPCAVAVASANLTKNNAGRPVHLVNCDGFAAAEFRKRAPFDLAIANILSGPLLRLAPDFAANVRTGGTVVLSGILESETYEVYRAYRHAGFSVSGRLEIEGWVTLELVRSGQEGRPAPEC